MRALAASLLLLSSAEAFQSLPDASARTLLRRRGPTTGRSAVAAPPAPPAQPSGNRAVGPAGRVGKLVKRIAGDGIARANPQLARRRRRSERLRPDELACDFDSSRRIPCSVRLGSGLPRPRREQRDFTSDPRRGRPSRRRRGPRTSVAAAPPRSSDVRRGRDAERRPHHHPQTLTGALDLVAPARGAVPAAPCGRLGGPARGGPHHGRGRPRQRRADDREARGGRLGPVRGHGLGRGALRFRSSVGRRHARRDARGARARGRGPPVRGPRGDCWRSRWRRGRDADRVRGGAAAATRRPGGRGADRKTASRRPRALVRRRPSATRRGESSSARRPTTTCAARR